tara:strand:+ start:2945 stop:3715 length:771 start_codon:yes stop_codon:yes gene_type:complete
MRTCLYGDSYVDPYVTHQETTSWASLLSQDFEIENYGLRGTGPDYSLDLLRKNGGDLIIFFVGYPSRYQWFELDHPGLSVDVADVLYFKNYMKSEEERTLRFRQFLQRNSEHIKYAYKSLRVKNRTEEVLGYLRNYADINQVRLIAILQENPYIEDTLNLTIPKQVRTSLNGKYFSLYPYNITTVSRREFSDLGTETPDAYVDKRQNHLTNPNHVVLYKNILATIERSELEDHLFHHTSLLEWNITKVKTGFIYDE